MTNPHMNDHLTINKWRFKLIYVKPNLSTYLLFTRMSSNELRNTAGLTTIASNLETRQHDTIDKPIVYDHTKLTICELVVMLRGRGYV